MENEEMTVDQQAAAFDSAFFGSSEDDKPETVEASEDKSLQDQEPVQGKSEDQEGDLSEIDNSEAQDDVETEGEEAQSVSLTHRVTMPNGEVRTIEELQKGFIQQADYTQKSMANAELRKQLEAQQQELYQTNEFFQNYFNQMVKEPDPNLASDDPVAYMQAKAEFDQQKAQMQQVADVMKRQQADLQQRESVAHEQYRRQEYQTLVSRRPEFAEQAKLNEFYKDAHEVLGIPAEQLNSMYSAMEHEIVADALAYRKLQSSKPRAEAKLEGKPKVSKPSRRKTAREQDANRMNSILEKAESPRRGNFDVNKAIGELLGG